MMLIVKSSYSINQHSADRLAVESPKYLPKYAKEYEWPAIVLADERTMAGALTFLEAAKTADLKAAVGLQLSDLTYKHQPLSMILIALDQDGLHRLMAANAVATGAVEFEHVLNEFDKTKGDGSTNIACLILPGRNSDANLLKHVKSSFEPIGIGCCIAIGDVNGENILSLPVDKLEGLAQASQLPIAQFAFAYSRELISPELAAGISRNAQASGSKTALKIQDVRIYDDTRIPQYLPEAFATPAGRNAAAIVAKIKPQNLKRKPELPAKIGLKPEDDANIIFKQLCKEGYVWRVNAGYMKDSPEARARLKEEVELIIKLGFSNYFLIMREAINYARTHDIPVGAGRGSAAGAIVSYVLGLTDVDPIKHKLFFERFINPERVSLPDIDTDFCEERRGEIIKHLATVYGDERVAQIATYASRKPRGSIREAARAFNLQGMGEQAIKIFERAVDIDKRDEEDFAKILTEFPDPEIQAIGSLASKFHGLASHPGVHAGGIVISDDPISTYAPVSRERANNGRQIIEFDMKDTENSGFVKFDFLGLKTLTVIHRALQTLKRRGIHVDIAKLPDDDQAVFTMMRHGKTKTIFQIESQGMTNAARQIGVNKFEDIVALVALYRPGPMKYIELYADRKAGRKSVEFLDPILEPILKDTFGIIIYQEQIMMIARVWAGYTMAGADNLRRAIGKKIPAEVLAQRGVFLQKALEVGRDPKISEELFEQVMPFAEYGFNRSHAVAYATITWQTAWLKYYHPDAWLAAVATYKDSNEDMEPVMAEAHRSGILIELPCINQSKPGFHAVDDAAQLTIRMPLESIKGIGAGAAATAIAEREKNGPFRSLRDLMIRTPAFNKNQIESLANAGALDCLSTHSPAVMRPMFCKIAGTSRAVTEDTKPQLSLFSAAALEVPSDPEPDVEPVAAEILLERQQKALGALLLHQNRSIKSVSWRREVESLVNLIQAKTIAHQRPCQSLGIVQKLRESLVQDLANHGAEKRRFYLNLHDETGQHEIPLSDDCSIPAEVYREGSNKAVQVTIAPCTGESLVNSAIEIVQIKVYPEPLEEPREYPVLYYNTEITPQERKVIMKSILEATRIPVKKPAKAAANRKPALLVIPPSQSIEIIKLPQAALKAPLTEAFAQLAGCMSYHP